MKFRIYLLPIGLLILFILVQTSIYFQEIIHPEVDYLKIYRPNALNILPSKTAITIPGISDVFYSNQILYRFGYFPPVYIYFLSFIFITGVPLLPILILLLGGSLLILYKTLLPYIPKNRLYIVTTLCLLHPPLMGLPYFLGSETLFLFFTSLFLYHTSKIRNSKNIYTHTALSLIYLALIIHTRSAGIILIIPYLLYLFQVKKIYTFWWKIYIPIIIFCAGLFYLTFSNPNNAYYLRRTTEYSYKNADSLIQKKIYSLHNISTDKWIRSYIQTHWNFLTAEPVQAFKFYINRIWRSWTGTEKGDYDTYIIWIMLPFFVTWLISFFTISKLSLPERCVLTQLTIAIMLSVISYPLLRYISVYSPIYIYLFIRMTEIVFINRGGNLGTYNELEGQKIP